MLEARAVQVRRGNTLALHGVSLSLRPGEALAIVGPNGAGKTTLLRCMAGILVPTQGEMLLNGRPMTGRSRREIARSIAYSPQESEERFGFTVRQAVQMGRHPWVSRFGSLSPEDEAVADRALSAMDLDHISGRPVTELSGGEKRRVALARTLAQGGGAYLLDEPAAGLDIRHAFMAMREFTSLAFTVKAAVAVVLHDLNLAAMFCPIMLMLDAGGIAAYGATPDVLTPENVARVFGVRARIDGRNVRFLEE